MSSIALRSRIQGRLAGMLPKYFGELSKYQPLWLEADDDDLKMRIEEAHALNHKSDTSCHRPKIILDRFLDGYLGKLSDMCNQALASRHGWILELCARLYGVNIGHCAFEKLWICLSNEKRDHLAKLIYLMSEPRYCQLKKLLFNIPNDRYWDFVHALDRASGKQFNHYIRLLSTTDRLNPVDVLDGRVSGTLARPFTNEVPRHLEVEVKDEEFRELQQRIFNLPHELGKMIELALWDDAFRPGKIFPHNQQTFGGKYYSCGKFYDQPIPRLFHALNKELYTQMRKRYWSENVWVIGYGNPKSTMGFIKHVQALSITSPEIKLHLELRFSSNDIPASLNPCPIVGQVWLTSCKAKPREADALDVLRVYQILVRDSGHDLRDLWFKKLRHILRVKSIIEELTIDLNEAFVSGDKFAAGTEAFGWHHFRHAMPPMFKVRAPSAELEDEIYSALRLRHP